MSDQRVWIDQQFPLTFYKEGETKTCVFWDLGDFPIPDGVDPASIHESIKDAIKKQGCHGDVLIEAYSESDKDTLSDGKYSDAGFQVQVFSQDGKHARIAAMLADMTFWALDNLTTPANVILLAKIEDKLLATQFRGLCTNIYGYFCCTERRVPARSDSSFLTSIFDPVQPKTTEACLRSQHNKSGYAAHGSQIRS